MPTLELYAAVAAAAVDTPYVVTPTAAGFDVALDCGNQRWNGLLRERGVHRSAIAHVRAGEGWYSIADAFRTVSWDAGTGQLSGGASRSFGRFRKLGRQRSGSIDGTGQVRPTAELSFDTDEARGLVTPWPRGWA